MAKKRVRMKKASKRPEPARRKIPAEKMAEMARRERARRAALARWRKVFGVVGPE